MKKTLLFIAMVFGLVFGNCFHSGVNAQEYFGQVACNTCSTSDTCATCQMGQSVPFSNSTSTSIEAMPVTANVNSSQVYPLGYSQPATYVQPMNYNSPVGYSSPAMGYSEPVGYSQSYGYSQPMSQPVAYSQSMTTQPMTNVSFPTATAMNVQSGYPVVENNVVYPANENVIYSGNTYGQSYAPSQPVMGTEAIVNSQVISGPIAGGQVVSGTAGGQIVGGEVVSAPSAPAYVGGQSMVNQGQYPNAESFANVEPISSAQPIVSSQPIVNAEPMVNTQPVVNSQSYIEMQPIVNTQPIVTQPIVNASSVNYSQPTNYSQPVSYSQPANYSQPTTYSQPTNYSQPTSYTQPRNYSTYSTGSQYASTGNVTPGLAQRKAAQAASKGVQGHLGGGLGGAKFEGVGWSNQSAQKAIENCCYWGKRPTAQIGVRRGRDGFWYACVLYH